MTVSSAHVAPLRRRLAAIAVDYALIAAYLVALTIAGWVVRRLAPGALDSIFDSPLPGELAGFVLITLPVSLYFIVAEALPLGATMGKRRFGLRVVPGRIEPLGFPRSIVRTFVKFLPWELSHAAIWRSAFADGDSAAGTVLVASAWVLLAITITMTILDRRHRALHDRIAGTEVLMVRGI